MGIGGSLIRTMIGWASRRRAYSSLLRLREIGSPAAARLASAVLGTLEQQLDTEEAAAVQRIEAVRRELSDSTTIVSITDFGAGKAGEERTGEVMRAGVVRERTIGETCRGSSRPLFWSLLLFRIVREFKPARAIELGACLGISGAFQASALQLNGTGRLVTLEGAASLAAIAKNTLTRLGLEQAQVVVGPFHDTLAQVLAANSPVDYGFIDGHHDERATIAYFEQFLPVMATGGVLVFDDIAWSDGMRRAWAAISAHASVNISLDLGQMGICVLDAAGRGKHTLRLPSFRFTARG